MSAHANNNFREVDILIVGAGISGIGIACHLKKRHPGKTVAIIEGRAAIGGTWDLFRYPGVRSDSDMHTLGFSFKPWRGERAIVEGAAIRDYVEEAAIEYGVKDDIMFSHHVERMDWSERDARWTVASVNKTTGQPVEVRAQYVAMCTGYYDYASGHAPQFAGSDSFQGEILHPQHWPESTDYRGKSVVVIGSGATAISLAPHMARSAGHVTMLQRTPTYIMSIPAKDRTANFLKRILPARWAYGLTRKKNVFLQQFLFRRSKSNPEWIRNRILKAARKSMGEVLVEEHFTPTYAPWDQRLCFIPDNDLFDRVNDGSVSIVTDEIERFTPSGIELKSGKSLPADIIVTATGLKLKHFGGVEVTMDGVQTDMSDRLTYKGVAYQGIPNLVTNFGYFNTSWTMKVDLTADYFCRLIDHMDRHAADTCRPRMGAIDDGQGVQPWITGYSSGYIARGIDQFPKQTGEGPWVHSQSYDADRTLIGAAKVDDDVMIFTKRSAGAESPSEPELKIVAAE